MLLWHPKITCDDHLGFGGHTEAPGVDGLPTRTWHSGRSSAQRQPHPHPHPPTPRFRAAPSQPHAGQLLQAGLFQQGALLPCCHRHFIPKGHTVAREAPCLCSPYSGLFFSPQRQKAHPGESPLLKWPPATPPPALGRASVVHGAGCPAGRVGARAGARPFLAPSWPVLEASAPLSDVTSDSQTSVWEAKAASSHPVPFGTLLCWEPSSPPQPCHCLHLYLLCPPPPRSLPLCLSHVGSPLGLGWKGLEPPEGPQVHCSLRGEGSRPAPHVPVQGRSPALTIALQS